jgi:ribosomal protein L40E
MPLITCRDCGKSISDAAPVCIHCGRPNASVRVGESVSAVAALPDAHALPKCRSCGSTDVRTLPVVHESGTTLLNAITLGVGIAGRKVGAAGASTSGTQKTVLAERATPPKKMEDKTPAAVGSGCATGCVAYVIAASALGATAAGGEDHVGAALLIACVAMLAVAVPMAIRGRRLVEKYNSEQWPFLHAQWQRSVLCMRCGAVTDPTP